MLIIRLKVYSIEEVFIADNRKIQNTKDRWQTLDVKTKQFTFRRTAYGY